MHSWHSTRKGMLASRNRLRSYAIVMGLVALAGLCAAPVPSAYGRGKGHKHHGTRGGVVNYSSVLYNARISTLPPTSGKITLHAERIGQWRMRVKSASLTNVPLECVIVPRSLEEQPIYYEDHRSWSLTQAETVVFESLPAETDGYRYGWLEIGEAGLDLTEKVHDPAVNIRAVEVNIYPDEHRWCTAILAVKRPLILPFS